MQLQSSDNQPWYKQPWPWILMAGPLIVIIAGFITAWLAFRSYDGLVADDYYKQGLAINQQLQRDHVAGNLGLQANVMRSSNRIRVMLTSDGQVNLPEKLVLRITHPTRAGMDQNVSLMADGGAIFSGKLDAELSGRWHVVLEDPAGKWRLHGDWQADTQESVSLLSGNVASTGNQSQR